MKTITKNTPIQSSIIRLASVPFLNAKLLTIGLDNISIQYMNPKDCLKALLLNQVDCALIPSINLAYYPLAVIPSSCIASRGSIGSVLLFSQCDLLNIQTIAIDNRSTTSIALLKILCQEVFHIDPLLIPFDHKNSIDTHTDATLLIGDDALWMDHSSVQVFDLGHIWHEWIHLPFVYAVWAVNQTHYPAGIYDTLEKSKNFEKDAVDQICQTYPDNQRKKALYYLTQQVSYDFGECQIQGLTAFFEYAKKHQIIECEPELKFIKS